MDIEVLEAVALVVLMAIVAVICIAHIVDVHEDRAAVLITIGFILGIAALVTLEQWIVSALLAGQ